MTKTSILALVAALFLLSGWNPRLMAQEIDNVSERLMRVTLLQSFAGGFDDGQGALCYGVVYESPDLEAYTAR